MRVALERLGYISTYHGMDMLDDSALAVAWERTADAKWFRRGTSLTRRDFDALLGNCAAMTDMPCAAFASELLAAYYDAKVVLVQREFESWWRSFEEGVVKQLFDPVGAFLIEWVEPLIGSRLGPLSRKAVLGYFGAEDADGIRKNAKGVYYKHYDDIRKAVSKERLLAFELSDGWEPLCAFLGKGVPDEPFPRVNDAEALKQKILEVQMRLLKSAGTTLLRYVAPMLALAGAVYCYRS